MGNIVAGTQAKPEGRVKFGASPAQLGSFSRRDIVPIRVARMLQRRSWSGKMALKTIEELCNEAELLWNDTASPDNFKKSFELFKQAFDNGEDRLSPYRLGNAYYYGRGVERDLSKALELFSRPSMDGERYALFYRGLILSSPNFAARDDRRAIEELAKASKLGLEQADVQAEAIKKNRGQAELDDICDRAEKLMTDTASDKDLRQALKLFESALEKGEDKRAPYKLGVAYYYGRGVERDLSKALELFSRPSMDGERYALFYRGLILSSPNFAARDDRRAIEELAKASKLGLEQADVQAEAIKKNRGQAELDDICDRAEKLMTDTASDKDLRQALKLFESALEKGEDKRAPYKLGVAYYYGRGVERDLSKALELFSRPSMDGERYALYFRGLILNSTDFSGFDEDAALKAFRRAAELGIAQAKAPLEEILRRRGCPICGEIPDSGKSTLLNLCPHCHSVAGERAFALAYRRTIVHDAGVEGKTGLLVRPSDAENRLFSEAGAAGIDAVDDGDLSAALAKLPGEADFVYSSYDLAGSADAGALLAAFRRVLKPGGKIFLIDPQYIGAGKALEDAIALAAQYFAIQLHSATDPLTKQTVSILAGTKSGAKYAASVKKEQQLTVVSMICKNKVNEIEAGCQRSREYMERRRLNPYLTYTDYATALHAAHTNAQKEHATLGKVIPERSKTQGHGNYVKYRDILGVGAAEKVLEYGCGSLRVGIGFVKQLGRGQFYGLDVVPDFYEDGVELFGPEHIKEKDVRFHTIDAEGIAEGWAFQADHVFASAVVFHIHPDDAETGYNNLAVLTSKPGAKLIFDCKVTRDSEPRRFAQTENAGGWAWPIEFYKAALAPLELTGVHDRVVYDRDTTMDYAHLEFRMPHPCRKSYDD